MKNLIAMMMVACAAAMARADFILYWNVDSADTSATAEGYNYALLYTASTDSSADAWSNPSSWVDGLEKGSSTSGEYTFSSTDNLFFYVALANYVDESNITILKTSQAIAANTLKSEGYISTDSKPAGTWAATSFSVPEPTSGLLLLVGAAMLALKRRRA